MPKEEKPLEYQHRIRDTKGVAQRLDLSYLKRPAVLLLLRKRMTWILVAVAAMASLLLVTGAGGSRRVISNGPVSQGHALFESRCEVCHVQKFAGVPDTACERCHDGGPHPAKLIDTAKVNAAPACVQCHVEHRGKTMLADISSGNCTSCHANLTAHASGVRIKSVEITAFRQGKHPEFSTAGLKDSRPFKLNHAIHMPDQPKSIRGIKLPMTCSDCHSTDRNSPTGALLPVKFEQNCRTCHSRELEFDVYQVLGAKAMPAPHTRDPKTIRDFVETTYRDALAANPGLLQRPLGNDVSPQLSSSQWLGKVSGDSMAYLFERKCGYCHELAAYAEVKKVDPIAGRYPAATPWLERGEFSHHSHRAVKCESCHVAARTSSKTEDVLIPPMKTCLPCHGESRAGLDQCSVCHLYHNRSLEKDRDRRSTDELLSKRGAATNSLSLSGGPL